MFHKKIDYPIASVYAGPAVGVEAFFRAPVKIVRMWWGKLFDLIERSIEEQKRKLLRIELKEIEPVDMSFLSWVADWARYKLNFFYTAPTTSPPIALSTALIAKIIGMAVVGIAGIIALKELVESINQVPIVWTPAVKETRSLAIAVAIPASLFALVLLVRPPVVKELKSE